MYFHLVIVESNVFFAIEASIIHYFIKYSFTEDQITSNMVLTFLNLVVFTVLISLSNSSRASLQNLSKHEGS